MAKNWYPVIDYSTCVECGTCVSFCQHGVYNTAKAPTPVVWQPEGCIDHCHGCGSRCPVGAITYVGDDTGWTPPNRAPENTAPESGCGCGSDSSSSCCNAESGSSCCGKSSTGKKVLVEYLYLDLQTCDRCMGTDDVLEKVMLTLEPTLRLAGYTVEYSKVKMETAELAEQYHFLSSPTIRVNGQDLCLSVKESSCGCCSDISGTDVDCRVFEYNGETYEVPPAEMLADAVLQAVYAPHEDACGCGYTLPDNLKNFYAGKNNKSSCGCGCSSC